MSRGEPPNSTLWPEDGASVEQPPISTRHVVPAKRDVTKSAEKFQVKIQHVAMFNYYSLKGESRSSGEVLICP